MSEQLPARIVVDHLTKEFKLPHERHTSLKSAVVNFYKKKTYEKFVALKNISFEVQEGEFFGIVGRNGSGKSTLLKLLAQIYVPTSGTVKVNGRLTPFIELGVGFNPELTGRENVFLNGAILGLTQKEVETKYDEIVAFSELERFMDQKLKNYSSGMQVRLAFSIAIQAHNDVLLIDEVLAVGDANFQRKCYNVFKDIKKSGRTVIFVTHDMSAVQDFCDRAMMIEDSKIVAIGKPREIALRYEVANMQQASIEHGSARPADPVVKLNKITILPRKSGASKLDVGFGLDDDIHVDIDFTVRKPTAIQFNLFLVHSDGRYTAGINTTIDMPDYTPTKGRHTVHCTIKKGQLAKGEYRLNTALYTYCEYPSDDIPDLIDVLDSSYGYNSPILKINEHSPKANGEFNMQGEWSREGKA